MLRYPPLLALAFVMAWLGFVGLPMRLYAEAPPPFLGELGKPPGTFRFPHDLTFDSNGNFYVVDAGNARIQKFDSAGNFLMSWGSFGSAPGRFT